MGNEILHLCSTTNTLQNSCLVRTAHSLPLLRLLLFIINERNKCVTSSLINDSLNSIECRGVYHHQWSSTCWSFGYAFACLVSLMEIHLVHAVVICPNDKAGLKDEVGLMDEANLMDEASFTILR